MMFKKLIKTLADALKGGRMLRGTAMLLLRATIVSGVGTLLFAVPVSAEVCSKKDAAETALRWLNNNGKVISVSYDKDDGGYWVRLRDYKGEIRDFFVERGDKC